MAGASSGQASRAVLRLGAAGEGVVADREEVVDLVRGGVVEVPLLVEAGNADEECQRHLLLAHAVDPALHEGTAVATLAVVRQGADEPDLAGGEHGAADPVPPHRQCGQRHNAAVSRTARWASGADHAGWWKRNSCQTLVGVAMDGLVHGDRLAQLRLGAQGDDGVRHERYLLDIVAIIDSVEPGLIAGQRACILAENARPILTIAPATSRLEKVEQMFYTTHRLARHLPRSRSGQPYHWEKGHLS